jgi:hypothetical protein
MSTNPTGRTPGQPGYIRGGGGVEVDSRRIVQWAGLLIVLALAGVVIALTLSAAADNSRQTKLKEHGIPVEVTVTGCVGIGSGIGQATAGYTCRGSYSLDGTEYSAVIRGANQALPPGDVIQGVTVRGDPGLLSTAEAARKQHSSSKSFVTPIILGAITILLAVGLILWSARRRGRSGSASGDTNSRTPEEVEEPEEPEPREHPAGL